MKELLKAINRVACYLLLKIKFANKHSSIRSTRISRDIQIGKKVSIGKNAIIQSKVQIGDYSYLNTQFGKSYIDSDVVIGKYCSIAPNVCIALGGHDLSYITTSPILYDKKRGFVIKTIHNESNNKKTVIGNDVWIGANANIKKGITIGNGAVVAMNSVVTKNVPDYAIVAGNPAKIIRYRFKPEEIKKLLEMKWWDWPEEKIRNNIDAFYNIENFIAESDNK